MQCLYILAICPSCGGMYLFLFLFSKEKKEGWFLILKECIMTNLKNSKWFKFHFNFLFILEVCFDQFRPVKLSRVLKVS